LLIGSSLNPRYPTIEIDAPRASTPIGSRFQSSIAGYPSALTAWLKPWCRWDAAACRRPWAPSSPRPPLSARPKVSLRAPRVPELRNGHRLCADHRLLLSASTCWPPLPEKIERLCSSRPLTCDQNKVVNGKKSGVWRVQAQWHRLLTFSSLRVLELVLQGKRNGHRDFCPSAGIHENDITFNRLRLLARRFRDVVEQLRDFSNAQHGSPH
jgi:hypothetical protein